MADSGRMLLPLDGGDGGPSALAGGAYVPRVPSHYGVPGRC